MSMLPLSIFSFYLVSFRELPLRLTVTARVALKTFLPQLEKKIWRSKEIVEINMIKLWGNRLSQISLSLLLDQEVNFLLQMLFLGTVQH